MEPPGSSNARRRMQATMQQPSMPTAAQVQQISGGMRPLSLGSASSFKRPFFYSQFGPIVDGKRQCLHCPAQLAATEASNPTHLRTHLLRSKKCGLLSSTAAAEIAKTESCVASKLPASSTQKLPTPTHALFNWVVQEAIPFSVVESPAFQAFVAALNPSFVLPSRYSMSGHMLLEEYAAVKAEVASRLAALPFVAITVDGWSQKQGAEHCLAWCVAGSQETFMLDCVHTEADSVTAVYIANMFDEVISKHNLPTTPSQYGATAIEMHYGQQAGGAAVGNQDPAALVAHGQLPSLHACLVAAKQPTTPSQSADPALFSVQPHLAGTPVAIALSWLKRQQELQQEKHCQAWLAGSRELLAEAIPLFKARWRYGDSQVLYLAAILDPRYKMLDFQFSPAQFSQAEQALSRLVTVDDSQADQPVAMALEQLRRGWGAPPSELLSRTQLLPIHFAPHLTAHPVKWWAERGGFAPLLQAAAQRVLCIPATAAANERVFSSFKHIWSDKRSSLLLGRMWLLAFIYFNKRVLERRPKPQPEAEWQQFAQWMQHMPVEA
ncbi:hypothetical protein QJQ45_006380 [Haematococcus lacustris]|nr:hypothetical protein QJQ45_006380 [Haematococcus lacustris]